MSRKTLAQRGGSWYSLTGHTRSAYRYESGPTYRGSNLGFRVLVVRKDNA